MLINLYLPKSYADTTCTIANIRVTQGQRLRRDQVILYLGVNGKKIPFTSPYDGWIRFIAVKANSVVEPGDLLVIIDAIDVNDYRIDDNEVNLHTELGEDGRRGLERKGQVLLTDKKGYSGQLFDAPSEQQGQAQRSVKDHPVLKNMKEGVPPKMADARNNGPATDRLADDANRSPELQNQLSAKLQAQLGVSPGPSTSPTLTR